MHKIYVAGAGPGDSSLLTLKAKKYLEGADVIYYDPEVHPNFFFMSKKDAKWISLAQKKGKQLHASLQKELLLDHAIIFLLPGEPDKQAIARLIDQQTFPYTLIPGVRKTGESSPLSPLRAPPRAIVLRGLDQSQSLMDALCELDLEVMQCPMIELQPNEGQLKHIAKDFLNPFTHIIFTSANGVKFFFEHLQAEGIDFRTLAGKHIFTVGPKTESSLKSHGLIPDATPKTFVAESILDLFHAEINSAVILIPTAEGARDVLPKELANRGAKVRTLKIYRNITPKPRSGFGPIAIRDGDMVIFTSSSTADHFFNSPLYKRQRIVAFCIGEITRKSVAKYLKEGIYTSRQATSESLVEAIREFLNTRNIQFQ